MLHGWHYLPGGEDDAKPALPCATFLDLAPSKGLESNQRLCRPYVTGRPDPSSFADKASSWHQKGCRVQALNEPNLPQEGFGGTPADYQNWFFSVKAKCPGVRLYWAGMSPGVPGWEAWYAGAGVADGIAAHAYGTRQQMQQVVEPLIALGRPLWLAEVNFGAGQTVDRDRWAEEELEPFLDWCSQVPLIEAVSYFAYKWPTPDMSLPTPVDGAGTRIETVLRTWSPPEEATVPDIALSVPTTTDMASLANYQPGPRAKTLGVVVHTTRGGAATPALELSATVNWFKNPSSGVSAHLVIGQQGAVRCVHDPDIAWHARAANQTHLGLEIVQQTMTSPITEFQYRAAAEACRLWAGVYGFPLTRRMTQTEAGLVGHEDCESGKLDHKTDPGVVFDWPHFMQLCRGAPAPAPVYDIEAARARIWKEADALEANGWPWYGQGLKAATSLSKGEH